MRFWSSPQLSHAGRSWPSCRVSTAATRSRRTIRRQTTSSACFTSSHWAYGCCSSPHGSAGDPTPASLRSSRFGRSRWGSCRWPGPSHAARASGPSPMSRTRSSSGPARSDSSSAASWSKHPEYGLNVVGFIDREPQARRADLPDHLAILGGPERLADVVADLDVDRVIIAFSNEPVEELLTLLRQLREFPVQIDLVPRLFELVGPRVTMHSVEGLPLIGLPPARTSRVSLGLKRAIDMIVAGVALLLLSPLLAYIALRIRLDSRRADPVPPDSSRLGHAGVHRV